MKRISLFLLLAIGCLRSTAQPKLVVGIVVDQMRYDYIDKYWNKFGNDGFKRLVNQGYNCKNTNYNYVPTFTGPGHASIYTGTTPATHGIVSNEWVDVRTGNKVYCAYDGQVGSVGTGTSAGKMSPQNMISSTVGEELRKFNYNASKVIGIALKDRGAILPAGHKANAAYWFDGTTGNWITSTYYMNQLPAWVEGFNKLELAKNYLSQPWSTLFPMVNYTESDPDDSNCESPFSGKDRPVFPYDLPALMNANGGLGLIRSTPFGNSFTKDFVLETIKRENMGKGAVPDLLCVSFSSTDYIGHQFGPQSVEVEDCYLRLDKDLAELLDFLDKWVGKDKALVFLTSDHGASEAVPCLQKKNIESGVIHEKTIADSLKKFLLRSYGDTILLGVNDFDVYFNRKKIKIKAPDLHAISRSAADYLARMNGIADALTESDIQAGIFSAPKDSVRSKIKSGFYPGRSGDVIFVLKPGWLEGYSTGTSHGSPYWYDTHVPLLWWGYNIKKGSTEAAVTITQVAPTLSEILKIPDPDGCISEPINLGK